MGFFHDRKAAFHLQAGVWVLGVGRMYAADKEGLPGAKLGWFFFPEVQGGNGKANDIFGSVYGWLVSKDAPKEALDFMKVWLGKDIQTKLAAEGLLIPMVKGTADVIQNPFFKSPCSAGESFWMDWHGNGSAPWGATRVASLTMKLRRSPLVRSLRNKRRRLSKTPGPKIGFRETGSYAGQSF